jgi:DNA-directed RNA polymerase specialized sigma24 family protein
MRLDSRTPKRSPTALSWVAPGFEESADHQLRLLRAFDLPPLYREVVVLRELHGHAVPEIAALLGVSRSAVEKCLRRAERMRAAGTPSRPTRS